MKPVDLLTSRQRRAIVDTMRGELEKFGGIPPLAKRTKARTAAMLAEKYGLTTREVMGIWQAWVEERRARIQQHQRERFQERLRQGIRPATMSFEP